MTIDWSKAPEGATHYNQTVGAPTWYKQVGGVWHFEYNNWWYPSNNKPDYSERLTPRPVVVWRGPQDGLPPVGTEVEAQHFTDWVRGVVVAHVTADEKRAIIQCENAWFARGLWSIRPIKTERDRAIEEMIAVCKPNVDLFAEEKQRLAEQLYDAGYRKGEPTCSTK